MVMMMIEERGSGYHFFLPLLLTPMVRVSLAASGVHTGGERKNSGESSSGPGTASPCPPVLPIYLFHSSTPKDCTSFSINASPGVVIDVAHHPPAKKNLTGSSKWPLDPGLEVSLKRRAARDSTGDRKVSVAAVGWDV